MNTTIDINEANFEIEVLKSTQPALAEFATGYPGPHDQRPPLGSA